MTVTKSPLDHFFLFGLLLLTTFFAFYRLGSFPLQDGIESRNGVNAIEMTYTDNHFDLKYGDEPDYYHTKPPLTIWATVVSFQLFGFNSFGLRFPLALATIGLFWFLFKTIRLYQAADFAFFTCLILLTVKGLVGRHIDNLGEYDALFLCFAMGGTYHFLKHHDFKQQKSLYFAAFFFGLAFFTKGMGIFVLFVGLLLYTILRGTFGELIKKPTTYLSFVFFLLFPMVWALSTSGEFMDVLQANFNQEFINTSTQFGDKNYLLFFDFLDIQYQWWNYVFYAMFLVCIPLMRQGKDDLKAINTTELTTASPTTQAIQKRQFTISELLNRPQLTPDIRLLLFSSSIWLSLAIVCTLSQNEQFLAFSLPFIAIITAAGIYYLNNRYRIASYLFIGLLVFTMWGQFNHFSQKKSPRLLLIENETLLRESPNLACDINLPNQDVFLYLKFAYPQIPITDGSDTQYETIFCGIHALKKYPDYQIIAKDKEYAILQKSVF